MARSPKPVVAAGAVIWRERDGTLQVLAVHRPNYDDWSWPKGKPERGETIIETCAREVYEETGKQVVLGIPLPRVDYQLDSGKSKRVHYWAAHTTSTSHPALRARPRWKLASRKEIDNSKWFTVDQARKKITREADLAPLEALVAAWEKGRLDTRAVIIARHAHARDRKSWKHEDLARPLDRAGAHRARQLIPALSAYGIRYLHTSPAARCVMTLQPYATEIGKQLKMAPELTEDAHGGAPAEAAAAVLEIMGKRGHRAVCAHRPTLGTVLGAIAAHTKPWTAGKLPDENPYLPPGGLLVMHVRDTRAGPQIVAIETHVEG